MRLALCQMNSTVGDIAGNAKRIADGIENARRAGAQVVLFPELALTGYPPEDLLLREHFLRDARASLQELAGAAQGIAAVIGFPEQAGDHLYNSAALLADKTVTEIHRKVHLPNYGVFDERRYFTAGDAEGTVIELDGCRLGLTVCEDLWVTGPPISTEAAAGATLVLNISASPYHAGKGSERERLFAIRARESGCHIAFCAMVGGQDELVFDGHSFVLDPAGETIARAEQFQEDLLVCDVPAGEHAPGPAREPIACTEQEVYQALLLGLRDYVHKNGFGGVVLGLSGGIDSALVACLAVNALGAERVNVAVMPSRYSSTGTQKDARALAQALGVRAHELPIERAMGAYTETLSGDFDGLAPDLTEENLQARIRGNLLMALLTCSVGWC